MKSRSFRDLLLWQKAIDLSIRVYSLIKQFPKEENYALSDQLRRAVVSIPSNIAEGQGRGSRKEFIHFLLIAKGSLCEVETQLEIGYHLNYLSNEQLTNILILISEINKMLNALITHLMTKN